MKTGASIPCHFWHHGGAYSVFWCMTVETSQQQWNRFWWPPLWFWATHAVFNCACVYKILKFVLEAPGVSILWGRYYSVTMCRLTWGALLIGRALLIGTLRYVSYGSSGGGGRGWTPTGPWLPGRTGKEAAIDHRLRVSSVPWDGR